METKNKQGIIKLGKFGIGSPKGILFLISYLGSLILVYYFNNLLALFILLIVTVIQYHNNISAVIKMKETLDSLNEGPWLSGPDRGYGYVTIINNFIDKHKKMDTQIKKKVLSYINKKIST